jgi:hypothetical protein
MMTTTTGQPGTMMAGSDTSPIKRGSMSSIINLAGHRLKQQRVGYLHQQAGLTAGAVTDDDQLATDLSHV